MGASGATGSTARAAADRRAQEAAGRSRGDGSRVPDGRRRPDAAGDRAGLFDRESPVIFVDSNVPMYLVGADHPHKVDARRLLEAAIAAGERLVTDAEVL